MAGSLVNIPDVKTAKQRKDMYQSYISKAAIGRLIPMLRSKLDTLLEKLVEAGEGRNGAVDLSIAFRALTADTITEYCWHRPLGALDREGFEHPFMSSIDELIEGGRWDKYFPRAFGFVDELLQRLPRRWAKIIMPAVVGVHELQDVGGLGFHDL